MNESYYRLSIRFTNGETAKFILREPIDTAGLTDTTRFVLVQTINASSSVPDVFLASFADVSYLKTEQGEGKELRHRVAGITSGLAGEDSLGPDAISTVEFI
jgi:hypothetical protein